MIIFRHILKGSYCLACATETPNSIHGRCLCGWQKHPSTVLEKRGKLGRPFVIRPKFETVEEIAKIMRKFPLHADHMRVTR